MNTSSYRIFFWGGLSMKPSYLCFACFYWRNATGTKGVMCRQAYICELDWLRGWFLSCLSRTGYGWLKLEKIFYFIFLVFQRLKQLSRVWMSGGLVARWSVLNSMIRRSLNPMTCLTEQLSLYHMHPQFLLLLSTSLFLSSFVQFICISCPVLQSKVLWALHASLVSSLCG